MEFCQLKKKILEIKYLFTMAKFFSDFNLYSVMPSTLTLSIDIQEKKSFKLTKKSDK